MVAAYSLAHDNEMALKSCSFSLVWSFALSGRCRVMFSIPSVFGRVAPQWVARFVCVHQSHSRQVAVAHLTFRLCFHSDNQILCVVWWPLQSSSAPSAVIYTFFFSSVQIDWLGHCTSTPPQTRQPHDINHKLTFIGLILYFRIPVTSVLSPKAMSVASVFQITNCAAVQRFDQSAGSTSSNTVASISNVI